MRIRMKAASFGTAALVMALVACGGGAQSGQTEPTEGQEPTQEPGGTEAMDSTDAKGSEAVELTFWNYWDGKNGEVMQSLVDDWNAQNPDVQVENVFIGFNDLLPKLQAAAAGGDSPDVAAGDLVWLPKLTASGRLSPLGDEIDTGRFFPEMLNPGSHDGAQYSVPVSSNNLQLFYNKELFEQAGLDPESPPSNWSELQDTAGQCADPDAGVQGMELFTEPGEGLTWQFQVYLWQAGGDFLNEDGTAAAFNSPEGERALNMWLDLIESGSSTVAPWGAFGQGKACMAMDGSWMVGIWSADPPFDFGTATMPHPEDGQAATNMGGEQLFVMADDDARRDAAMEFISYLTSDDVQIRWDQETGFTPVLTAVAEDDSYRSFIEENQPRLLPFVEGADDARSRPSVPSYPEVSDAFSRQIERALLGQIDAAEALAAAEEVVNAKLTE